MIVSFSFQRVNDAMVYGNLHLDQKPFGRNEYSLYPAMSMQDEVSCEICGKRFGGRSGKYNMKRHLTIHAPPDQISQQVSCDVCGKIFKGPNGKAHLKRHGLLHLK